MSVLNDDMPQVSKRNCYDTKVSNQPRCNQIVRLYLDKQGEGLDKNFEFEMNKVKELDENYIAYTSLINSFINKDGSNATAVKYQIESFKGKEALFTEATLCLIERIKTTWCAKKRALNDMHCEIEALLNACDTYEQEVQVLIGYGIIKRDEVNGGISM